MPDIWDTKVFEEKWAIDSICWGKSCGLEQDDAVEETYGEKSKGIRYSTLFRCLQHQLWHFRSLTCRHHTTNPVVNAPHVFVISFDNEILNKRRANYFNRHSFHRMPANKRKPPIPMFPFCPWLFMSGPTPEFGANTKVFFFCDLQWKTR